MGLKAGDGFSGLATHQLCVYDDDDDDDDKPRSLQCRMPNNNNHNNNMILSISIKCLAPTTTTISIIVIRILNNNDNNINDNNNVSVCYDITINNPSRVFHSTTFIHSFIIIIAPTKSKRGGSGSTETFEAFYASDRTEGFPLPDNVRVFFF
jgi:hypothetical protein